ncbi:MAG TPA: helix-turn-helix transcriptional regulator [Conexibacter sp.]|nr:helix-turn-helix transcriptional regulator [Conexibacter sp.]
MTLEQPLTTQPTGESIGDLPLRHALGRTVRQLRRFRDLSQAEFADRAGLARNHIGEIERSAGDLKLQTIVSLADALDIHPSELLARAEAFAREQPLMPPQL